MLLGSVALGHQADLRVSDGPLSVVAVRRERGGGVGLHCGVARAGPYPAQEQEDQVELIVLSSFLHRSSNSIFCRKGLGSGSCAIFSLLNHQFPF